MANKTLSKTTFIKQNEVSTSAVSQQPTIVTKFVMAGVAKTNYQLWLDAGNTGSFEDYQNSLKIQQEIEWSAKEW